MYLLKKSMKIFTKINVLKRTSRIFSQSTQLQKFKQSQLKAEEEMLKKITVKFDTPEQLQDFILDINNSYTLINYLQDNESMINLNTVFTVVFKLRDNFKNFEKYSQIQNIQADPFFEYDDFFKLQKCQKFFEQANQIILKNFNQNNIKCVYTLEQILLLNPEMVHKELIELFLLDIHDSQTFVRKIEDLKDKHYILTCFNLLNIISQEIELDKNTKELIQILIEQSQQQLLDNQNVLDGEDKILIALNLEKLGQHIKFQNIYLQQIDQNFLGQINQTELTDLLQFFYYVSFQKQKRNFDFINYLVAIIGQKLEDSSTNVKVQNFHHIYRIFDFKNIDYQKKQILLNFQKLDIQNTLAFDGKENPTQIFVLNFYFEQLMEQQLLNEPNLYFIAETFINMDPQNYDQENFLNTYYNLALHEYFSEKLVKKDILIHIQQLLVDRPMLGSLENNIQKVKNNLEQKRQQNTKLNLLWALTQNIQYTLKQQKKLNFDYINLLKNLSQQSWEYLGFNQKSQRLRYQMIQIKNALDIFQIQFVELKDQKIQTETEYIIDKIFTKCVENYTKNKDGSKYEIGYVKIHNQNVPVFVLNVEDFYKTKNQLAGITYQRILNRLARNKIENIRRNENYIILDFLNWQNEKQIMLQLTKLSYLVPLQNAKQNFQKILELKKTQQCLEKIQNFSFDIDDETIYESKLNESHRNQDQEYEISDDEDYTNQIIF